MEALRPSARGVAFVLDGGRAIVPASLPVDSAWPPDVGQGLAGMQRGETGVETVNTALYALRERIARLEEGN